MLEEREAEYSGLPSATKEVCASEGKNHELLTCQAGLIASREGE